MTVTIIGSGMVGATLALALSYMSKGTLKINLVEEHTLDSRNHPSFGARAIALTQGTCRELSAIKVWSRLSPYATAISHVEVSDKGHFGKVYITANDYHLPALGYVIELCKAGKQLFNLLHQAPGVVLHCPATFIQLKRERKKTIILLDNGNELEAQLVVLADGSRSSLAEQFNVRLWQRDYRQIAVVANITTALPHGERAFERFTSQGPLALLPISESRSSLFWCLSSVHEKNIRKWNEQQFCKALQQEFGWRLGHITNASERQFYPLILRTAERHITHRMALVGNAAQTLHPIAGQGFNLGLRDAITLAEILSKATVQGEDIGEYIVLSRYQRRRKPDQAKIVSITDGLINIFTTCYPLLVIGRNLSMLAMTYVPFLRDTFVHKILSR